MKAFKTITFPLSSAFAESHKCRYIVFSFSFMSKYFLISLLISSLAHWLLKSLLFNFHLFNFSVFVLLLISSLIPLLSKKIIDMIAMFLNLLRCVL